MRADIVNYERQLLFHLYYDIGVDLPYNVLYERGLKYQRQIGPSRAPMDQRAALTAAPSRGTAGHGTAGRARA
jgi:hypothetical protein